jgi:hypothetical protein
MEGLLPNDFRPLDFKLFEEAGLVGTEARGLVELGFVLTPRLPGSLELRITHLARAGSQLLQRFPGIQIGRIDPVPQHKVMHGFAAREAALGVREMVEEEFVRIIGGRQAWEAITGKQAPPPILAGLDQVPRHGGSSGVGRGGLGQAGQERLERTLDLLHGPRWSSVLLSA